MMTGPIVRDPDQGTDDASPSTKSLCTGWQGSQDWWYGGQRPVGRTPLTLNMYSPISVTARWEPLLGNKGQHEEASAGITI